jgi:transcriptional regulator with XRE-family HTH domain
MPTATHRPVGLRAQASTRRHIETRRRWAARLTWLPVPGRGWLADVRVASGLSTRDVAARLGVSQPSVVSAEASERAGTIHMDVLVRYADAMDADVHYVVVPRASVLLSTDSQGRKRRQPLRLRAPRRKPGGISPGSLRVNDTSRPIVSASEPSPDDAHDDAAGASA